jgi:hypothetical protein
MGLNDEHLVAGHIDRLDCSCEPEAHQVTATVWALRHRDEDGDIYKGPVDGRRTVTQLTQQDYRAQGGR